MFRAEGRPLTDVAFGYGRTYSYSVFQGQVCAYFYYKIYNLICSVVKKPGREKVKE